MKRAHKRTLGRIARVDGGTHWTDVEALLTSGLGAEVDEGTGSTATFIIGAVKLTIDRPHSRKECGRGLVRRVKAYLQELGFL